LFLIPSSLFLSSCTVNPFEVTTAKGHQVTSLGGSFLTKTTKESGTITRPDGTVMSYGRTGKDETRVPIAAGQVDLAKTGLNAGSDALGALAE
jgi:ferric-dicitrate binding protein FerR (iron transport regulator)